MALAFEQFLKTVDVAAVRLDGALDATIKPTVAPVSRRPGTGLEPFAGSGTTLRVKQVLGEGGMGVVQLAEQGALLRDVAVKTLKDVFAHDAEAVARLIQEARITGLVEHPNVVPLYALQQDAEGAPQMVMKRIEGVPWREVLRDPSHPLIVEGEHDELGFHLDVLMCVCDALAFAHSRGIVHLDVKPDNVMIGSFREVYLVDWGVAASMREEHRGVLPLVSDICEIIGTPAYMPPEMVDFSGARVGPRSDVYLLAATLHEILTGSPPHAGDSLPQVLYEAYCSSPPTLPPSAPEELAAIVLRGMAVDPADRFDCPASFRRAIADFIGHRGSVRTAAAAAEQLERLKICLAEPGTTGTASKGARDAFIECSYGFRHALKDWPDNRAARRGLAEAVRVMAERHLKEGDPSAAEAVLSELGEAPPDLASGIDRLRLRAHAEAEAQREDAQRGRDQDYRPGRRKRGLGLLTLVTLFNIPGGIAWWLDRQGRLDWGWTETMGIGVALLVVTVLAVLFWRRFDTTDATRRLSLTLIVLVTSMMGQRVLSWAMGLTPTMAFTIDLFMVGAMSGVVAHLVDRRAWVAPPFFFLGALLAVLWPDDILLWVSLAATLGPVAVAVLWIRDPPVEAPAAQKVRP